MSSPLFFRSILWFAANHGEAVELLPCATDRAGDGSGPQPLPLWDGEPAEESPGGLTLAGKDGCSLSIIIIAYNEEDHLPHLLDSLLHQTWRHFEVIVVDSKSDDRTREIALSHQKHFARFQLVELPAARGPAFARNQGFLHAKCERLLFLDADVTLEPGFLEAATDALRGSKIDLATCFVRPNKPSLPSSLGVLFLNASMRLLKPFYTTAYGACLFSTRTVHEGIGGFAEDLAICEDCNYVKRALRQGGLRFRILPLRFGTSDRRAHSEGSLYLLIKYIRVHLYRLFTGREIGAGKLVYDYGNNGRRRSSR